MDFRRRCLWLRDEKEGEKKFLPIFGFEGSNSVLYVQNRQLRNMYLARRTMFTSVAVIHFEHFDRKFRHPRVFDGNALRAFGHSPTVKSPHASSRDEGLAPSLIRLPPLSSTELLLRVLKSQVENALTKHNKCRSRWVWEGGSELSLF